MVLDQPRLATAYARVFSRGYHLGEVRRALRQAWELDDAAKAEKLIRNLAQRLERDAPGRLKKHPRGIG